MKERPMLFNGEMVRAIIDGRKTQTRRPMKVQPPENWGGESERAAMAAHCPHGVVGDRIWVRETWTPIPTHNGSGRPASYNDPNNRYYGRKAWYCADNDRPTWGGKWIPSIHMPRWACRIVLEITDVRVQRVQEISNADIRAEGACEFGCVTHRLSMEQLWDSCYGAKWFRTGEESDFAWDKNPWVWALTFKRMEGDSK